MKSQIQVVLAVIVTAVVVGGGVYTWQQKEMAQFNKPVTQSTETKITKPDSKLTDLFDQAKNTKNEFAYLVTAEKLDGNWKMMVNNNHPDLDLEKFSLEYKSSPWGNLRYQTTDLTATDGGGPKDFQSTVIYYFCAGNYYCDEDEMKGMGFELRFWNAKFEGRAADPEFYLKDGGMFLKENEDYIVTYKPFKDSTNKEDPKISDAVGNLMKSFELY